MFRLCNSGRASKITVMRLFKKLGAGEGRGEFTGAAASGGRNL